MHSCDHPDASERAQGGVAEVYLRRGIGGDVLGAVEEGRGTQVVVVVSHVALHIEVHRVFAVHLKSYCIGFVFIEVFTTSSSGKAERSRPARRSMVYCSLW